MVTNEWMFGTASAVVWMQRCNGLAVEMNCRASECFSQARNEIDVANVDSRAVPIAYFTRATVTA